MIMHIYKVNDEGKAYCEKCNTIANITYQLRDVPFSDSSGIVKDILAGVCNECGMVTTIPHQSVPAIKRELKQKQDIEARVPPHIVDILNVVSDTLGGSPSSVQSILKYYIHALSHEIFSPRNLNKLLDSELAKGRASKRLSLKGLHVRDDIELLKTITHLKNTTDVVKGVALKINEDILVNKRKEPIKQLQLLVVANS